MANNHQKILEDNTRLSQLPTEVQKAIRREINEREQQLAEFRKNNPIPNRIGQTPLAQRLAEKREELLASGVSAETVVHVDCTTCEDTGYVRYDLPIEDPQFGKMHPCPENCAAVQRNRDIWVQRIVTEMRQQLGNSSAYANADFTSLLNHPQQARLTNIVNLYMGNFPHGITARGICKPGIVFFGEMGTGKTWVASIIHNMLTAQGIPVYMTRLYRMLEVVLDGYRSDSEYSSSSIRRAIAEFPLLIIDEFDMNNHTSGRMDVMEDIINARYQSKKPTIITTNLSQQAMYKTWGGRITDRLVAMTHWIEVKGRMRDESAEFLAGEG
jgi:DNA replication protein DnaC